MSEFNDPSLASPSAPRTHVIIEMLTKRVYVTARIVALLQFVGLNPGDYPLETARLTWTAVVPDAARQGQLAALIEALAHEDPAFGFELERRLQRLQDEPAISVGLPAPSHPIKVFLCHSSSDKSSVRRLRSRLFKDGIQPWLDEEDILPGHDWGFEIQKAIRESDIVLVCLSETSVSKVGYLQKEIRSVLDVADEQPEGTIFLIPARLEPVNVPERLRRWQWVDLFEETGYSRLLQAMRSCTARAGRLPDRTDKDQISETDGQARDEADHQPSDAVLKTRLQVGPNGPKDADLKAQEAELRTEVEQDDSTGERTYAAPVSNPSNPRVKPPLADDLPDDNQQGFKPTDRHPERTLGDQAGTAGIGAVVFDTNDVAILSVLDSIGRTSRSEQSAQGYENEEVARQTGAGIIRNLVARCLGADLDEQVTVWINYIGGGSSGSYVLRVDLMRPGDPSQAFILKFGLDRISLDRARRANSEAQKVLSEQGIVSFIGDLQTDASGYHAVIMRVAQGSIPLADWLLSAATPSDAAQVAEALFGELLSPLFGREGRRSLETTSWLALSVADKVRTQATLARYEPVLSYRRTGKVWSSEVEFKGLRALLEGDGYVSRLAEIRPDTVQFVRSFGDLHSKNVVVQGTKQPRPVLIDASLYGFHHWASDSARLIVDLFLRVRSPGVESLLWNDLEESVGAGERLCPRSYRSPATEDGPLSAFIATSVTRAAVFTRAAELGILSDDWHWQWHAAIAKEFLRQSSNTDLTPPRAALALLLAARHLRWSIALLRRGPMSW